MEGVSKGEERERGWNGGKEMSWRVENKDSRWNRSERREGEK